MVLSSNSVIPVAEKHFGAILLPLFSITTILIRRKFSALMSKLPSNTGVRGDLACASCGLLILWFIAKLSIYRQPRSPLCRGSHLCLLLSNSHLNQSKSFYLSILS